jgi:hypothetical protein
VVQTMSCAPIGGKSTMTQARKCRKFQAEDTWPRRALPSLVPDSIFLMRLKALRVQKIYQRQRSFDAVATIRISLVRSAASLAFETGRTPVGRSGFAA